MPAKATRKPARKRRKPKAPKAPPALAPETTPPEPGESRIVWLGRAQTAGVSVTPETALMLAAVWACLKVLSEDIAGPSWHVMRSRPGGGVDVQPDHPVDWLLNMQPNPETGDFQFREVLVWWAASWGNGYGEIERDRLGRPAWLWQLTPDRVTPDRDEGGVLGYWVSNFGAAPDSWIPAQDMFHLRGPTMDGIVGYDVIALAARVVGAGIAMTNANADFWANDATPGGVLKHPGRVSEKARQNILSSWEARHQGSRNKRRIALLEEGLEYAQTALAPEDSHPDEAAHGVIEDVCRFFRVPPQKIMHLLRMTFNNVEHLSIDYVTDSLVPWARRLESEANLKLFGRQQRGLYFTKVNLKARLRGDIKTQTEHLDKMMNHGVYSINDALEFLDRNPIGPLGDKRLVQINMTTLEKVGEEPPKPRREPPPPAEDEQEGDETEQEDEEEEQDERASAQFRAERLKAAYLPVLTETCARILRRERGRLEQGQEPESLVTQQAQYAAEALAVPLRSLGELVGAGAGELAALVDAQIAAYAAWVRLRTQTPTMNRDPAEWAESLAARLLMLAE